MRKKILFLMLGVVLVAATAIVNVRLLGNRAEKMLMLANVEALADPEEDSSGPNFHCRCHSEENGNCLGGNAISFRRSCYKGKNMDTNCHEYDRECL